VLASWARDGVPRLSSKEHHLTFQVSGPLVGLAVMMLGVHLLMPSTLSLSHERITPPNPTPVDETAGGRNAVNIA
jgi:hypothetical protein